MIRKYDYVTIPNSPLPWIVDNILGDWYAVRHYMGGTRATRYYHKDDLKLYFPA